MAKGGRPRALDEDKKREVVALFSAGCSWKAAAKYVGCSALTVRREAERDKHFGEQIRKAQVRSHLQPLQALRNKAATHWRAAAWLLERVDPEQYVRFDQQLYSTQEVADLLENVKATLEQHLLDEPNRFIAGQIMWRVQQEAQLPRGKRNVHANLAAIPWGHPTLEPSVQDILELTGTPVPSDLTAEETP